MPSLRLIRPHLQTAQLRRLCALALLVFSAATPAARAAQPEASLATPAEYLTRLQSLDKLLANCQAAITPANCPSSQVGPDLQLHLSTGDRPIHFAWLRNLLDQAAGATPKPATPKPLANPSLHRALSEDEKPVPIAQQLDQARQRLAEDRRLLENVSGQQVSGNPPAASSTHPRAALTAILAGKDYKALIAKPTLRQRLLETLESWVERVLGKLAAAGARAKWIGITAEVAFILALCLALAWFLIRLERQGRIAAASGFAPASGAASARDWQLWLEDARQAAARLAWRDAIHLLYWASISRLESSGLWPADRARTPREYLTLLAPESQQHPTLNALTRTFERTWYAGHPATQSDFQQAEQLAARLGAQ
jgi:hypothetical protein